MIRKVIFSLLLMLPFLLEAQNYNPFVAQGIVSPAPLAPVADNGTGVVSFLVGNTGDDPLPLVTNQEMLLVITLSRGVPNDLDPLQAVGGTMSTYFDWIYDAGTFSYLGTQNKLIPDALNGGVGTVEILYKVTSNSIETNPQNGFNVNLTPPAYTNGVNSLNDDQVSSYTWTETPVKTVPDMNATFVDSTVAGKVNTNDKVPVGTSYGTPSPKVTNPSPSTITMLPDGSYTFSAPVPGVYVFDVPVCPPGQTTNCPTELLTITVIDATVNTNPPTANVDQGTTYGQTPITLNTLGNDACNNLNCSLAPGSVSVITQPKNGTVTVDPLTGNTTYTANAGFYGVDSLTYEVCDSTINPVKCVTSIQVITVLPKGGSNLVDPVDDYRVVPLNTQAIGNVVSNDNDPEGDNIDITPQNINIPGKGSLVLGSDGSYTFTPLTNYSGTVEVPYDACDNGSPQACAKATLYITITPQGSVLASTLQSFTGLERNCQVELYWATIQENNSSRFEVERKRDQFFEKIGSVAASGNSTTLKNYSFIDENTSNGSYVYRLKMVDVDGKFTFSDDISVSVSCLDPQIVILPNPFTDQINVTLPAGSELCTVKLFDAAGRTIYSQVIDVAASSRNIEVSTQQLSAGTYYLYLNVDGQERNEKMIKQ